MTNKKAVDIILMGIYYKNLNWFPKDVDKLFIADECDEYEVDYDIYHITCIKEKTESSEFELLHIYFKCYYADRLIKEYFAGDKDEKLHKNAMFQPPYLDCNLIADSVYQQLIQDLFHFKKRSSLLCPNEKENQPIADFFNSGFDSSSFTPDIAMFKEDDGTYHFDS